MSSNTKKFDSSVPTYSNTNYTSANTAYQNALNNYTGTNGMNSALATAKSSASDVANTASQSAGSLAGSQAATSARSAGLSKAASARKAASAGANAAQSTYGSTYSSAYSSGLSGALQNNSNTVNAYNQNVQNAVAQDDKAYNSAVNSYNAKRQNYTDDYNSSTGLWSGILGTTVSALGSALSDENLKDVKRESKTDKADELLERLRRM